MIPWWIMIFFIINLIEMGAISVLTFVMLLRMRSALKGFEIQMDFMVRNFFIELYGENKFATERLKRNAVAPNEKQNNVVGSENHGE